MDLSTVTKRTGAVITSAALIAATGVPANLAVADVPFEAPLTSGSEIDSGQGSEIPPEVVSPAHAELQQTDDVEVARQQLENAKKEHASIEATYASEKQKFDSAKEEFDAVEASAAEAEAAAVQAEADAKRAVETELGAKQQAAQQAQADLEAAQAELERLEGIEAQAQQRATSAQATLEQARSKYQTECAASGEEAEGEVTNSKANRDAAKAAYDSAAAAQAAAQEALEKANSDLAVAKSAEATARAAKEQAEAALSSAQSALDDATTLRDEAKAGLAQFDAFSESDEYKEAQGLISEADAAIADAQGRISENSTIVAEQQRLIDEYEGLIGEARIEFDQAKTALDTAAAQAASAKTTLERAQARYTAATEQAKITAEQVTTAQDRVNAAKEALDQAHSENEQAQRAVDEAIARVNTQQAEVTRLEAEAGKETEEQRVFDAWDFYASLGDAGNDAISVLEKSPHASQTIKGDQKDATSLANMLKSVEYLKQFNALRQSIGLPALQVNLTMMAIAQTNANWSKNNVAHSGRWNIGENLAWGADDPWYGWYYDEKQVWEWQQQGITYEQALAEKRMLPSGYPVYPGSWQTGHYLAIVNSNWKYTGFAVNTDVSSDFIYPIELCQVFSDNLKWIFYDKKAPNGLSDPPIIVSDGSTAKSAATMSVEKYEQLLKNFIQSTQLQPRSVEFEQVHAQSEESAELQAARQALAEAQAALDALRPHAYDKANSLAIAQAESDAAANQIEQARQADSAAQSRVTQEMRAVQNAQRTYNNAQAASEEAQTAANAAESKLSDHESDQAQAKAMKEHHDAVLLQAQSDRQAAQEKRATAIASIDSFAAGYAEAAQVAEDADANYALTFGEHSKASGLALEASAEHGLALSTLQDATTDQENKEQEHASAMQLTQDKNVELLGAEAAYATIKEKYLQLALALESLHKAQEALSLAEASLGEAATSRSQVEDSISPLSTAASSATEDYETTAAILDWDAIKDGSTVGAYEHIDALLFDMQEKQAACFLAQETLEQARSVFAPVEVSFGLASLSYNDSLSNIDRAQNIYASALASKEAGSGNAEVNDPANKGLFDVFLSGSNATSQASANWNSSSGRMSTNQNARAKSASRGLEASTGQTNDPSIYGTAFESEQLDSLAEQSSPSTASEQAVSGKATRIARASQGAPDPIVMGVAGTAVVAAVGLTALGVALKRKRMPKQNEAVEEAASNLDLEPDTAS